jgi:hypothetical protein
MRHCVSRKVEKQPVTTLLVIGAVTRVTSQTPLFHTHSGYEVDHYHRHSQMPEHTEGIFCIYNSHQVKFSLFSYNYCEMFEELIKDIGLPSDIVEASLEIAIAESMSTCLDLYDCDVDLKNSTAVGVFRVSQDISFGEALFFNKSVVGQDIVTVKFDFASFPRQVVRRCSEIFPHVLFDMEASARYREWQSKRRTVVDAVVIHSTSREITLDLGGQIGLLLKEEWVPTEAQQRYRAGKPLSVYVLRIKRHRSAVTVFVSRQSRNLVVALLRRRLPWHSFQCVYRKAGSNSIVVTDCPLDDKSLEAAKKDVETELGERIRIKHNSSVYKSRK